MAEKLNMLKFKKSEFPDIDQVEKERTLGKLQILEVLAEMIQNFRETYTRLLVVNAVEPTKENTSKDSEPIEDSTQTTEKNSVKII